MKTIEQDKIILRWKKWRQDNKNEFVNRMQTKNPTYLLTINQKSDGQFSSHKFKVGNVKQSQETVSIQ